MSAINTRAELPKPDALLFDWDGTLVDSHPVLAAAMNHTLESFEREPWTFEQWEAWLGLSARDAFPKEFGDDWEKARKIYLEAYGRLHLDRLQLIEGAAALMGAVIDAAIPMSVVSNKTGHYLRKEAAQFEWGAGFVSLIGSGDSAQDKPAPDPVYDALKAMAVEPGAHIWFIGDNDVDVRCGKAAGCTTLLLGAGYPDSKPDYRFSSLAELQTLISEALRLD